MLDTEGKMSHFVKYRGDSVALCYILREKCRIALYTEGELSHYVMKETFHSFLFVFKSADDSEF